MAFDSFRDFLSGLEAAGELKRRSQPVATELEISELADREMKKPGGGTALLFEKPTVNGTVSPIPLAINTMGSHKRMAMALGAGSVDELAAELASLMKAKPPTGFREALQLLGTALDLRHAKPKLVKTGPCKDLIRALRHSRRIAHRILAARSRLAPTLNPQPSTLNFAEPAHPEMLAFGRRTIPHAAVRGNPRPGHGRSECGHVPHAGL